MNKVGTDIVEVDRIRKLIDKYDFKFLTKIFTPEEIEYCNSHRDPSIHFAGRFSAKEATLKALSGKYENMYFKFNKINIINDKNGRPYIDDRYLPVKMQYHKLQNMDISISHTSTHAISVAILNNA